MARDNTAIDYRRFSAAPARERSSPVVPLPENQNVALPKAERRPSVTLILSAVLTFVLATAMVANFARITELTTAGARVEKQITELEAEQKTLEAKRDKMYSLTMVEEYVTTRLGMVKSDNGNTVYVDLSSPEAISLTGNEKKEPTGFFADVFGKLGKIVEYFN